MAFRGSEPVALSVLAAITGWSHDRLAERLADAPRGRMNTAEPWYTWNAVRDLLPARTVTAAHWRYERLALEAIGSKFVASGYPDVVATWHPTKNGPLRPWHLPSRATTDVWWKCAAASDHVWRAKVSNRTGLGTGCPFCAGKRVCRSNSLARVDPDVARAWDREKNGDLTPADVTVGSKTRVWWRCKAGRDHRWSATIDSRTGPRRAGCPFCANDRVSATNTLEARFPTIAREWDRTRNGALTPSTVVSGSMSRVWWRCGVGPDHRWQAAIVARTGRRRDGCPFCANQRVSMTNSLAACFPDVAAEWHPTRNRPTTPSDIVYGSTRKVWWWCPYRHVWQSRVVDRTGNGQGCRACWYSRNPRVAG